MASEPRFFRGRFRSGKEKKNNMNTDLIFQIRKVTRNPNPNETTNPTVWLAWLRTTKEITMTTPHAGPLENIAVGAAARSGRKKKPAVAGAHGEGPPGPLDGFGHRTRGHSTATSSA
jgi:hypothetical protein